MTAIHIRTKVDSETMHLPELKPLIGKNVEIIVVEAVPAARDDFYAEAVHVPETAQEQAAQQAQFRAWRSDPRFERFWPLLDRCLTGDVPIAANGDAARHPEPAS